MNIPTPLRALLAGLPPSAHNRLPHLLTAAFPSDPTRFPYRALRTSDRREMPGSTLPATSDQPEIACVSDFPSTPVAYPSHLCAIHRGSAIPFLSLLFLPDHGLTFHPRPFPASILPVYGPLLDKLFTLLAAPLSYSLHLLPAPSPGESMNLIPRFFHLTAPPPLPAPARQALVPTSPTPLHTIPHASDHNYDTRHYTPDNWDLQPVPATTPAPTPTPVTPTRATLPSLSSSHHLIVLETPFNGTFALPVSSPAASFAFYSRANLSAPFLPNGQYNLSNQNIPTPSVHPISATLVQ